MKLLLCFACLRKGTEDIDRRHATESLGDDIAGQFSRRECAIYEHGEGDRRVYVATAEGADAEDDEGERQTNH